jgi:transposase
MQQAATREKWAKRVERWKDSGLSAKEFAAETGINARSLVWWRWEFSKGDTAPKQRRRRRSPEAAAVAITKPPARSPMKFVELMAPVSRDSLEVILPSTMRICVRPGFDAATLGRLLDVLEQRR